MTSHSYHIATQRNAEIYKGYKHFIHSRSSKTDFIIIIAVKYVFMFSRRFYYKFGIFFLLSTLDIFSVIYTTIFACLCSSSLFEYFWVRRNGMTSAQGQNRKCVSDNPTINYT